MVKVHKMVCIDWEIAEQLKNINASELINGLLFEHFRVPENMSQEAKNKRIAELKIKIEAIEKLKAIGVDNHGIK